MPPIPAEYLPFFWDNVQSDYINLTCLMPTGIVILLRAHYNATLSEIKEDLWDEATKRPLFGMLQDMSIYVFTCVNSMAELEELTDETKRICDVRPTAAVLIITECKGNSADHSLDQQIAHLIGKRLQEFENLNSTEINDFRFKMRKMGEEIAAERNRMTWIEKLNYHFPPNISSNTLFYQEYLSRSINISIKFECDNKLEDSIHTFSTHADILPNKFLEIVLTKKAYIHNTRVERTSDYILKVCGKDEYLFGNHSLIKFQYIEDCIKRDSNPKLIPVHIDKVPIVSSNDYECVDLYDKKSKPSYSTLTLRKKVKQISSWTVLDKFKIRVCTVSNLNCDIKKVSEVGIHAGLFHGGKSICQQQKSSDISIESDGTQCWVEFDEELEFDIEVANIPRNAKLCFVIYASNKNAKGTKNKKIKDPANDINYNPIAWANTTVYDFKGQLRNGAMTLFTWAFAEDMLSEDVFHPLGTVVNNPNTNMCAALTLNFHNYGEDANQNILFPSVESICHYALSNNLMEKPYPEDIDIQTCAKILQENDNLFEVHDQDRKNIWALRHYWLKNQPEVLPKLLYCIDWDKRDEVSAAVTLLQEWPRLPVERALELLDYAYADPVVRSYAVSCLMNVTDEDLLLYLLQLVQAIKHELYLESDLVNFLLKRALTNQRVGHYLFWHLRSEMQVPSVSVRFGLILEAYCRGSQEHIPVLTNQLHCSEKMKKCSEDVRIRGGRDKEKARAIMKENFSNEPFEILRNLRNPLDPSYRCLKIKLEKCRVMDSKMKPLWVVFENSDVHGEDIYMIFKNGDDLRQDMLTLQMLRIMDRLWKRSGLDLRIIPYNCISLEHRVGMIEVVLNAETIANIQKEKGMFSATAAFRKGPILAWLKDYNKSNAALNKAVQEFTLSCAGYCVATYVLGIADRHSDNIMVTKSGQLFHIDFGHILGHFKEKFGFKRERVPFVLTHDFVYVINKGQKTADLEFKTFQEYCEKAFLILRKHGSLILSLCAMMISTGLPELSSEKDLNYIRETLVLSKTEDEALAHFRAKFDEALSNSWKTSLNWATHNVSKSNKA